MCGSLIDIHYWIEPAKPKNIANFAQFGFISNLSPQSLKTNMCDSYSFNGLNLKNLENFPQLIFISMGWAY